MEPAETLKSPHLNSNLKFFEADRAFGIIDTVLFRGCIWEDAGSVR
jgi:hypothetical protein